MIERGDALRVLCPITGWTSAPPDRAAPNLIEEIRGNLCYDLAADDRGDELPAQRAIARGARGAVSRFAGEAGLREIVTYRLTHKKKNPPPPPSRKRVCA